MDVAFFWVGEGHTQNRTQTAKSVRCVRTMECGMWIVEAGGGWISTGCQYTHNILLIKEPNKSLLLLTVISLETYENCVLIIIIIIMSFSRFAFSHSHSLCLYMSRLASRPAYCLFVETLQRPLRRIDGETRTKSLEYVRIGAHQLLGGWEYSHIVCTVPGIGCMCVCVCRGINKAHWRISFQVKREIKVIPEKKTIRHICVPFPFHPKYVQLLTSHFHIFGFIMFFPFFWGMFATPSVTDKFNTWTQKLSQLWITWM